MNSEKYLKKLSEGNITLRLKVHADEYLGPGGQGVTIQRANQIKRETLLEAKKYIERLEKIINTASLIYLTDSTNKSKCEYMYDILDGALDDETD